MGGGRTSTGTQTVVIRCCAADRPPFESLRGQITLNGERWSVLDPLVTIFCSLYMLYGTLYRHRDP